MKGVNRVLRFFTTLLFTDRGEYSWEILAVEVAAVSGVLFCSVEIETFSPKIVVVHAAVLCTEVGPGTLYPMYFA